MIKYLTLSFALVGVLGLPSQAQAAAGGDRAAQVRERMQSMLQDLNLTDDQKQKLRPIWQEQMAAMKEIREDQSLTPQAKMQKFKDARTEIEPRVKAILTPEQFEKWQKQRPVQAGPGLQDALKELNLSEDQKQKLKPILQEQGRRIREVRQDSGLSPKSKMEELRTIQQEIEPQVKEILTAEQFEKWQKQRDKLIEQARANRGQPK